MLKSQEPGLFTKESIKPSVICSITKSDFDKQLNLYPEFKNKFQNLVFQRFRTYGQLFLSRIKDTPQERYADLLKNSPDIIKRVPQHYIASFLGVTPIALSRIRNRKPE